MPRLSLVSTWVASVAITVIPELAQAADDDGAQVSHDTLEEIVVQAQRRSESIQSVPIAVSGFDTRALQNSTIKDLRDLSGRVPGLVIDTAPSESNMALISIRGLSLNDVEKSFEPAVGVAVDGVFIGSSGGQLLDNFDLESLEVLRGPQGTLFGRNTIGGVISATRTKPTEKMGVKAEVAGSSFDTKRARLVLNTGEIGDILALKTFGSWDKTDGFVHNVVFDRDEGGYDTRSGGITALISPSPDVDLTVTYQHTRERGDSVTLAMSGDTDLFCAFAGAPGFSPPDECNNYAKSDRGSTRTSQTATRGIRNDSDMVTANLEWDMSPGLKLFSVTGYQKNHEKADADFDGTEVDFFGFRRDNRYRQFSQELRMLADLSEDINLLVGAFYFDSRYIDVSKTDIGPALGGPITSEQFTRHQSESYAGFADVQYKLSEKLRVSLGGRYTEDKKDIFTNFGQIGDLVRISVPTFTGRECVAQTGFITLSPTVTVPVYASANNCTARDSFGKFTWRVNADYTFEPGKMAYASFSTGFRSGGFNGRATSPSTLGPYQPENVSNYEGGVKMDWFDSRLRTNLALYYTKYKDKQEEAVQPSVSPFATNPQETLVKNVASATTKGIELEGIAKLSRELSATATFSYIDAEYDRFLNDVVGQTPGSAPDGVPDDVSTLALRRAPKYQWSTGLNYSSDAGSGRFNADVLLRYSSKIATCIIPQQPIIPGAVINDRRCWTKDRYNLSAEIGYTFVLDHGGELSLSVFGRNLTNEHDVMFVLPIAGLFTFGTPIQPRVIGAQIGFKY